MVWRTITAKILEHFMKIAKTLVALSLAGLALPALADLAEDA